ncbi:MAG: helix-turn-helix domain-containing protein [Planctomycetaceae bacterium]|nr:helix-turn-helix domain-containing protein [Planctomycetaceae bacterium]
MTTKKFLTAEEIVQFYGVDEATLNDLVKEGSLKALADRGTWKFRRDDIDSLIQKQKLVPTKEMPTVDDDAIDMITFAEEGPSSSAVDFIELDEEALSEQATMITAGEQSFFPKLAEDTTNEDSSSEVNVVLEPIDSDSSDSEIRLGPPIGSPSGETSDSDVQTLSNVAAPKSALTGDTSDSDVKSLSNVAAPKSALSGDTSDSDVKTISSYGLAAPKLSDDSDSDVKTLSSQEIAATGSDDDNVLTDESASVFDITAADSGIALESPAGHDQTQEIELEEDDGISLPPRSSEQTMEMQSTGSSFDIASDSALKLEGSSIKSGDSSMLIDDPGSSVISAEEDSGISLDTGDSGISLDTGDSGISLDAGDSGISLSAADSGISLEADSGLTLDARSGRIKGFQKTEPMFDLKDEDDFDFQLAGAGATQQAMPVDDDMEATAAFKLDENDDSAEIPVKGKKADPLGFSGAIAAGATIENLEVVEELDEMFPEDDSSNVIAALEDDEVEELEASDESFAEFDEAPAEDDFESETYEVPTAKTKEPKERGWGAVATLSVLSASVLMSANAWLLWEGISTMWTGAEPSGPAAAIISSLAGLF